MTDAAGTTQQTEPVKHGPEAGVTPGAVVGGRSADEVGGVRPKRKRGRPTKEAEARRFLREQYNIDPDEIMGAPDDEPMPETDAAFLEEFKRLIWKRRHSLNDTAFTQLLNALSRMAVASAAQEQPDEEPLVADVIAGIVHLPVARKREILEAELGRLDAERARIVGVLAS